MEHNTTAGSGTESRPTQPLCRYQQGSEDTTSIQAPFLSLPSNHVSQTTRCHLEEEQGKQAELGKTEHLYRSTKQGRNYLKEVSALQHWAQDSVYQLRLKLNFNQVKQIKLVIKKKKEN